MRGACHFHDYNTFQTSSFSVDFDTYKIWAWAFSKRNMSLQCVHSLCSEYLNCILVSDSSSQAVVCLEPFLLANTMITKTILKLVAPASQLNNPAGFRGADFSFYNCLMNGRAGPVPVVGANTWRMQSNMADAKASTEWADVMAD